MSADFPSLLMLVSKASIKTGVLACSLLLLSAQGGLSQVQTTLPSFDFDSVSEGAGTADLPGLSKPIGGIGTQEIAEDEIERITPLPEPRQPQLDQNGYAYYYENVGEGEWEKVGVKLQTLGGDKLIQM